MLRRIWGIVTAFLSAVLPLLSFGIVGSAGRNHDASSSVAVPWTLSTDAIHSPVRHILLWNPASVCLKQLGNLHISLVLFWPQPKVVAAMISCMYEWPVVVNSHTWHTTDGLLGHRNFSSLFCTSILKLQFLNLVENWGWWIAKSPWSQLVCPRCFRFASFNVPRHSESNCTRVSADHSERQMPHCVLVCATAFPSQLPRTPALLSVLSLIGFSKRNGSYTVLKFSLFSCLYSRAYQKSVDPGEPSTPRHPSYTM